VSGLAASIFRLALKVFGGRSPGSAKVENHVGRNGGAWLPAWQVFLRGDKVLPYTTELESDCFWVAAAITIYTGYDYFKAGLQHMVE